MSTTNMGQKQRGSFLQRNVWMLMLTAVLVIVAIVTVSTWLSQRAALDAQEARASELTTALNDAEAATAERVDTDVMTALGVSKERLAHDSKDIGQLSETAFTWDSGLAYETARESVKADYDLSEKDPFLTEFMPPSRFNEDADGKRYYYIDTVGVNSTAGSDPDIEVVRVRADKYTYAVMTTVDVTSDSINRGDDAPAKVTERRKMLLFVTIDGKGNLSDLSGVPASGSTRESNG